MAIYFDLEYYVPKEDRNSTSKLKYDPTNSDHFILGGVFYQDSLPSVYQPSKSQKLWIWNMKNFDADNPQVAEIKLLTIINKIFEGELNREKSIKSVGIGIVQSDLPALFIRSQKYDILSQRKLYRNFFSGFPIDLSQAGIGFVSTHPYGFEPVPTNTLFSNWGIEYKKSSGSEVWNLYDEGDYHLVEYRTNQEVENIVSLYSILSQEID